MSEVIPESVKLLRDPATVRRRAQMLLQMAEDGKLNHFRIRLDKMRPLATYVSDVIRSNYPTLRIPYHGRWRHFSAGGIDRWEKMWPYLARHERSDIAKSAIDLAVVSVLLDAGAGAAWRYRERDTGVELGRSEGLAIASIHMFSNGLFSSEAKNPCQVDAEGLLKLDVEKLANGFQVDEDNPMVGLDGRIELVKSLAQALKKHPDIFGKDLPRPGNIFDVLAKDTETIQAKDIFSTLLNGFDSIWPSRLSLHGYNLGDVWEHSLLRFNDETDKLIPFHKLSQWMTYSLLEPFEWAEKKIEGLDELTGLAEYRNGGLFLDGGVLELIDGKNLHKSHKPSDELIVEWRALTVALLDELRIPVSIQLGLQPRGFPLARLLEGGSWHAGRKMAKELRPATGNPPLMIESDGTVF